MPSSSFLARVTKYYARPRLNPAENRLTEITAGVLEHVDGFAEELADAILTFAIEDLRRDADGSAAGGDALRHHLAGWQSARDRLRTAATRTAAVRTQVGTSSGGFVDLEIRLSPEGLRHDDDLILWIEVKHGAPLHGDQLRVYERDAPPNTLIAVVAPMQSMPEVPQHVPALSWQRLADVVEASRRRKATGSSARFILDAYTDYLKEEALMDDALTPTQAVALAHYDSAERVLERLCQLVDPAVERAWAPRTDQHSPRGKVKYEWGWWATYPLRRSGAADPPTTWRASFLEWGLRDDGGKHEDARDTTAFVAGATMYDDNPVVVEGNRGWVNDLRESGFAVYKGDYQRVWSYLYPEQLLAATSLDGQAMVLSHWVTSTFEALTAMPPPR